MDTYTPKPIDTSGVTISDDIVELTELLAKNVHEVYVQGRLAEGWRYGPRRDDAKKQNPTLVPYEELSESEKSYDRQTALETLRSIIALGYEITRPPASQAPDGRARAGEARVE